MSANLNRGFTFRPITHWLAAGALLLLAALPGARAQTITSDPADGATGVSVSGPVTFTFSSAVDPTQTTASFYSTSPAGFYPVSPTWSAGNTVLTCTPSSPFPANATISWSVIVNVTPVPVFAMGSFSTGAGSGGGGGGSGTNAITTLSIGKVYIYEQTNSSAPTIVTNVAYGFIATVSLASNRTASAVTVMVPGASAATSLNQNFVAHEDYYFYAYNETNAAAFEQTYPQGNYVYNVTGSPSNLQATVSMPSTMLQPNAPHISNFAALQSLNATQAVTVTWDAFQGGTSSDYIGLSLSDGAGEVFHTPYPGTNGVLVGTALSATIPAGTLAGGTNYLATLVFYRFNAVSNATYAAVGYRTSGTEFSIYTTGAASTVPVVSNPTWSGGGIGFDVATSPNQAVKVKYSTDLSLPTSQWQTLLTTNSPGTSVHITIPPQAGAAVFFRLQSGP